MAIQDYLGVELPFLISCSSLPESIGIERQSLPRVNDGTILLEQLDEEAMQLRSRESWNFLYRKLPAFSGILVLHSSPTAMAGGWVDFQVLNDSRFLCQENWHSYSLRIDRGKAWFEVEHDRWICQEMLLSDSFYYMCEAGAANLNQGD